MNGLMFYQAEYMVLAPASALNRRCAPVRSNKVCTVELRHVINAWTSRVSAYHLCSTFSYSPQLHHMKSRSIIGRIFSFLRRWNTLNQLYKLCKFYVEVRKEKCSIMNTCSECHRERVQIFKEDCTIIQKDV
jgi:hypothetical protein